MKRHYRWLLLLCALVPVAAHAQSAPKIQTDFKETTLKNGLRVITVEDHYAPVIAVSVTYNVGSRNERPGRTGFAHLFEHMMFQGSENVGKSEHFILINNNGGTMNGTTNGDRTNYYEALPANQLALALFLESDRMRSLVVNLDNLNNQRNAVQEERRIGVDNAAYGRTGEVEQDLMYDNFAYKHDTIGSMEDLNAATVDDVSNFFKIYYAPNNAVLVLVGDFKTAEALAQVRKYFENIPRQADPPAVDMTEPEQKAERRTSVDDQLARALRVSIGFKAVAGNTRISSRCRYWRTCSAAVVAALGWRAPWRWRRWRQQLAALSAPGAGRRPGTNVSSGMSEMRGPGPLRITATCPGSKSEDVEAAIYEEIERLKKEPIADWELQKAKNAARRNFINSLQSSLSRAQVLGQYTVYYNEPNLINTRLSKVDAVTKEDVLRVANKYLKQTNRTVVITIPKAGGRNVATGTGNE